MTAMARVGWLLSLLLWTLPAVADSEELSGIEIISGFARSESLYRRNNRPRTIGVELLAALTAPGLVTEQDYTLYFVSARGDSRLVALRDTPTSQLVDAPWSGDEQQQIVYDAIEAFFTEHGSLAREIERALGYADTSDLAGRHLAAFLREVREDYLRIFVRITIVDVYPGSHFDDTCIAEVRLATEEQAAP